MVQIEVDTSHLKQFGPAMPKIMKVGMNLIGQDMVNKLQRNSPVDQGLLKSWAIVEQSASMIKIRSPAKYARAQNYGSKHMIRPKDKKALHWGGDPGFFSKGHMINITGKHFVEKSIEQVKPRIDEHFQVAINEVLG